jgi:hypothetical protein
MSRRVVSWSSISACLLAAGVACEKSPTDAGTSAPAESAAAPSAPVAAASAPAAAPAGDLDVAALEKALGCKGESDGPCGVLATYAGCDPWDGSTPSGDGRWMGKGWSRSGGKTEPQITLLRARRVAADEVGPGQVPARIGFARLDAEHPATEHAEKAILALSRHDVPGERNQGIEYVTSLERWDAEAFATPTAKGHVFALAKGGGFLCQGPKQQLVLVLRSDARGAAGDGLYAELWPTTW